MRVLLTGASGLIGRELVRLAPPEWELLALGRRPPETGTWLKADLADPIALQAILPDDLDAVVHLAQGRRYRDFPECAPEVVAVNVTATAILLDHAVRSGAGAFHLASTATVYRPSDAPLDETAPTEAQGIYAASKRSAELLCGPYASVLGCRVLRIFTAFGAERDGRLVADLVDRVESGRPVEIRGERGLVTSPIHAVDAARALVASVNHPPAPGDLDVVNVGGAESLGLEEMATAIGAALGREPLFDRRPGTDVGIVADRRRCVEVLGVPEPLAFAAAIAAELRPTVEAVEGLR